MALRYFYKANDGTVAEATSRINDPLKVTMQAEEGIAAGSSFTVHDPFGTFNIRGLRKWWVVEDSVVDTTNRTILVASTSKRRIKRGSPFVGRARDWIVDVFDINTFLERRVMVGADCKRPAETDVQRIQWLLASTELNEFADDDFVFTANPVNMDAVDYLGQTAKAVIDDCAQQSGRNYYGFNIDTGDPSTGLESSHDSHVWYGHDILEDREADVRLSNVATDAGAGTLIVLDGSELERSPDRVYSGVFVAYANSYAYVRKQSTLVDFAARDATSPSQNVKTKAKAIARGNRYLNTADTEEDVITCSVVVPAADVNCAVEGERIEARFEHMPGYEDEFTWMRIVERTVEQLSPVEYRLDLKLSAPAPVAPAVPVYGVLRGSGGPYSGDGLVYWANPGDTPGPGYPLEPTVGPLTLLTSLDPPKDNRTHYGWQIDADGEINVAYYATVIGVMLEEHGTYTITWWIAKNGTPVATETATHSGDLQGMTDDRLVTVVGLSVANGDIITGHVSCTPNVMPFFRTPAGTGQNGERLEITGGLLA